MQLLLHVPMFTVLALCVISASDCLHQPLLQQIDGLLSRRNEARQCRDFQMADALKKEAVSLTPPGHTLTLTDLPTGSSTGSSFSLELTPFGPSSPPFPGPSVLQLSHLALGSSNLSAASRAADLATARLLSMPAESADRELMGRKAADAAFWFALAGVAEPEIFGALAGVAEREIERFGRRESCRPKDIVTIARKLTVAGVDPSHSVFSAAQAVLAEKGVAFEPPAFSDPGCLVLLFKFGARSRGQRTFLAKARRHYAGHSHLLLASPPPPPPPPPPSPTKLLPPQFSDSTLPLVLDLGCGYGAAVLGLSRARPEYNYLGVDRSPSAIGYARGIAARRSGPGCGNVKFVVGDALEAASTIEAEVVMINFPTPFSTGEGNGQLPSEEEWMVTPELLRRVRGRALLLQSNAEDVAVRMRRDAERAGWTADGDCVGTGLWTGVTVGGLEKTREPNRAAKYIAGGGERARGEGWFGLESPLLPEAGITETECNARATATPVLRCLLKRPK